MLSKLTLPSLLLLLIFCLVHSLSAQTAKSFPTSEVFLSSAAYLQTQDKVYAATGSSPINNIANLIQIIHPAWGKVEKSISVGYNPRNICNSTDEQFLYCTTDGPHVIQRINSTSHEPELRVTIPHNRQVSQLIPVPGKAQQLLVASTSVQRDTSFIQLLDGKLFQPIQIAIAAPEYIIDFGLANDSTLILWQANHLQQYRISKNGLQLIKTQTGVSFDFGGDGIVTSSHIITSIGKVINFSGDNLVLEKNIDPYYFLMSDNYEADFFYTMKSINEAGNQQTIQFTKYKKSDISIVATWESVFQSNRNNHSESSPLYVTGTDRLMYTFMGYSHIFWNCKATIPPPSILQGTEVTRCFSAETPFELSVNQGEAQEIIWSNDQTGATLPIQTAGFYAAKFTDSLGCQTGFSDSTQVNFFLPAQIAYVSTARGTGFSFEICKNAKINLQAIATYNNAKKWLWSTSDTTQTLPAVAGTYRVKMVSDEGCESAWSPDIFVKEGKDAAPDKPLVKLLYEDTQICPGETVLYETTPGYKYYWWSINPNNHFQGRIEHSGNINYNLTLTVRVANVQACPSETSTPISLNFYAAPPKPSISLQGNQIISSNTSAIHQWYVNDVLIEGSTGSSIPLYGGGFYTAKIYDGRCNSDFSNLVTVGGKVTSTNEAENINIRVYPNPTQDELNIDWPLPIQQGVKNIRIYSLDGKLQQNNILPRATNQSIRISTAHLINGVYWVDIQTGTGHFRSKFVKL